MLFSGRSPRRPPVLVLLTLALMVATVAGLAPTVAPPAEGRSPTIGPRNPAIRTLNHEVYGYLPYWRLDSGTADRLHYDLLSTIAFFGIGIERSGALATDGPGYGAYVGARASEISDRAHAWGVRVVPTFQLFDSGSLPDLKAFLGSQAAQARFIEQALALMARRGADGASLDFEPLPPSLTDEFAAFARRFRAAMRARFPDPQLVVAASVRATPEQIELLAGAADRIFVMAYDFRTAGSAQAGPVAPMTGSPSVKTALTTFLRNAPAARLIMGVPYYGYDWPVHAPTAASLVRTPRGDYGGAWSLTYAGARQFLDAHPQTSLHQDRSAGAVWFSYHDADLGTDRQVYFDDERSLAAKYDYAIARGLAGVGIWALDNDRGYRELWDLLRDRFYGPTHEVVVKGSVFHLARRDGLVRAEISIRVTNQGSIPERGILSWVLRDPSGRPIASSSRTIGVSPGRSTRLVLPVVIGSYASVRSGAYTLGVAFRTPDRTWRAVRFAFAARR